MKKIVDTSKLEKRLEILKLTEQLKSKVKERNSIKKEPLVDTEKVVALYKVLFNINKLVKKKNLNEEEIQEISESFWGNNMDRTQILGQRL